MRDEKEERKKQARSNKQTRQSNTAHPRQSLFLYRKNELPQVGLEPTTLYTLDRALYQLSYRGSSVSTCTCIHVDTVRVHIHVCTLYMMVITDETISAVECYHPTRKEERTFFQFLCFHVHHVCVMDPVIRLPSEK